MVLQKAIVTDFYIPLWQKMQLKPAQEFCLAQRHHFLLVAICIISVTECYAVVSNSGYTVAGNRYLVGIAAKVFYHRCYAAKRTFRIHIPFFKACFLYQFFHVYTIGLQGAC